MQAPDKPASVIPRLPPEVWAVILSRLSIPALLRSLALCSRGFRAIALGAPLWRQKAQVLIDERTLAQLIQKEADGAVVDWFAEAARVLRSLRPDPSSDDPNDPEGVWHADVVAARAIYHKLNRLQLEVTKTFLRTSALFPGVVLLSLFGWEWQVRERAIRQSMPVRCCCVCCRTLTTWVARSSILARGR